MRPEGKEAVFKRWWLVKTEEELVLQGIIDNHLVT